MGQPLTYAEIGALSDRAAKGLQELGVRKGVNVGLLLPNSPTFIIFYYGILKAGGTVVNFNPLYTVEELSHQAQDSGTKMMVTLDLAALFRQGGGRCLPSGAMTGGGGALRAAAARPQIGAVQALKPKRRRIGLAAWQPDHRLRQSHRQ